MRMVVFMDMHIIAGMFLQDFQRPMLVRLIANADPKQQPAFAQLFIDVPRIAFAKPSCEH